MRKIEGSKCKSTKSLLSKRDRKELESKRNLLSPNQKLHRVKGGESEIKGKKERILTEQEIKILEKVYKPIKGEKVDRGEDISELRGYPIEEIILKYNKILKGIISEELQIKARIVKIKKKTKKSLRRIKYILKDSLVKTISSKLNLRSRAKVYKKYGKDITLETKKGTIRFAQDILIS
jgi:hypothetical protein